MQHMNVVYFSTVFRVKANNSMLARLCQQYLTIVADTNIVTPMFLSEFLQVLFMGCARLLEYYRHHIFNFLQPPLLASRFHFGSTCTNCCIK